MPWRLSSPREKSISMSKPPEYTPSHLRLRPRNKDNDADIEPMDLSKMDDDPLSYFLTPPSLLDTYGEHTMDFEMDFDAGIEDFKHPPPIIRSVSPSSLDGLSLPHRPPTPPKSPGTPDSFSDQPLTPDDHDDYMHFAVKGRSLTFPIRLADLTGKKQKSHSTQAAFLSPASSTLSTSSGHSATRGRSITHGIPGGHGGRANTMPSRRSPHSWREPSPDVWSIEEETQDAINSEIGEESGGNTIQVEQGETAIMTRARARAVDIPAAKPKKRVRFVLPVLD